MYKSPIEIKLNDLVSDAVGKADEYIVRYVQEVGVNVDKDELIKALEHDRGQYEKGWNDRDAEIVRCKDCKHYSEDGWGYGNCYRPNVYYLRMNENDFCSYGESEEDGID